MNSGRPESSRRATRRRWRVPPALLHGPEALEGAGVLEEVPGELGLLLWQALRDVVLWAMTPMPMRDDIFSAEAERWRVAHLLAVEIEPELKAPLGVLTELVDQPSSMLPERVGLACRSITQWAEAREHFATALAFAQAAALSCPGDAAAGLKVGQLARRRAEHARAETWFRRTVALARQSTDWAAYALAFSGLGNLYMQRGNLPMARKFHIRAFRAARRHGLHTIQGDALHDLHVVATATGHAAQAQEYARQAYEAYGIEHPHILKLAHDVAYFWLTQGYFARALDVFRALLPHMRSAAEELVVLPNLVRAAAGAGDRETFEQGWKDTLERLSRTESEERHAEALLELARGAANLGRWDQAERAASRAVEVARSRGETRIEITAEALSEAVRNGRRAEAEPILSQSTEPDTEGEALAADFVRSLDALAVTG